MVVERVAGRSSPIDVLDRVLDKGIVIDAWFFVHLWGVELFTLEGRVVVASIQTYLMHGEDLAGGNQSLDEERVF
jgi:gas vesicle structural protein